MIEYQESIIIYHHFLFDRNFVIQAISVFIFIIFTLQFIAKTALPNLFSPSGPKK